MRGVIIRSVAVFALGGIVLAVVLYVASTVDARPPTVLSIGITQPVGDDPELALVTTSIEVEFSEPIDPASAEGALRIEPMVEGTTSWSGNVLIFTPADPLELDTEYIVTVAPGLRDPSGNVMEDEPDPFRFATAGRPLLVEADPADGTEDVPLDAPIVLRFSTLMDTASVEAALELEPEVERALRWSGEVLEIVPAGPLAAGEEYAVRIGGEAVDAAGVAIGEPVEVRFRTVASGLEAETLVPADGVEGISLVTAIAVVFDHRIDPESLEPETLVIEPDVAGTLEVARLPDEDTASPDPEDEAGRLLLFTPSGPLPPNTTFTVRVAPGLRADGGGLLATPIAWTFTTGAPIPTVTNQITFLSDRSGITNVWAMNPDGTGQRQLSAEIAPVLDYAVAPDGTSLVVADGRRLVHLSADGDERRVLTEGEVWDFDPTYSPDGQLVAFGRADALTGEGLGLWTWEVDGGAPTQLELPVEATGNDPAPDPERPGLLRAPRYAPDAAALAFVDASRGRIGILALPDAEELTWVDFEAHEAPIWLPDLDSLLVTGDADPGSPAEASAEPPMRPLVPEAGSTVHAMERSRPDGVAPLLDPGVRVLAVSPEGVLAVADAIGRLGILDASDAADWPSWIVDDVRVVGAAFAPHERSLAIAVEGATGRIGIERLDLRNGVRTPLVESGDRPRWQP